MLIAIGTWVYQGMGKREVIDQRDAEFIDITVSSECSYS
jgi:hypothetical protein